MISKATRGGLAVLLLVVSSLSVAAAPQPAGEDSAIEHARLLGAQRLDGEVFHVQGLALSATRIWVTSVDRAGKRGWLHEFDRATGKALRRLELTDGARYHPGGMSLAGGTLWVPVAEMTAKSSAVLVQIDTATMQVRRRIAVADHLGCVAVSGQRLVAGNWDSRLLYEFDLRQSSSGGRAPPRIVPNPSATRFQDMKFVGNRLVGSGSVDWWSGAVDWIDWPSLKLERSLRAGVVDPIRPLGAGLAYTAEGMALEGRDLYLIPEDGPSRVFHFRLDA